MPDIKVFEWNGHTWGGWWKGDEEVPQDYNGVELRQYDRGQLYVGQCMSFDVPNGDDWSNHEKGLDRYLMEGTVIDFYSGDFTLEGFVTVEHYGKSEGMGKGKNPEPAVYRKQRWVVTKWRRGSVR